MAVVICGGCGHELPDRPATEAGCGRCGGSCRKVHCPYCGYENPVIPALLRRLSRHEHSTKE